MKYLTTLDHSFFAVCAILMMSVEFFQLHATTLPSTQIEIFVSNKGNDKARGSIRHPVKTLHEALCRAANYKNCDVVINLRQGVYETTSTIEIGAGEFSSLTLRPYKGEEVAISGGRRIPITRMSKVADRDLLSRIPLAARDDVFEIDFKKLQIPMADLHPSGYGRPNTPSWTELFADENPLQIARWPNDTTLLIGKVIEAGTGEHVAEAPLPVFKYSDPHPSQWGNADSFWIAGYFAHGYASDMIRVKQVCSEDSTIHLADQSVYGFMTGADWRRWYALNLVEELDTPGEYVIDKNNEKMYVFLPKGTTSINVSVLGTPVIAIEHTKNIIIEGLTIEYGRHIGIYMENTEHVRVQDCTIKNMGGVGISIGKGTETDRHANLSPHAAEAGGEAKSRIVGDVMGRLYQDVVFDRCAGHDNGIVNCYLYNLGCGGISLGGGSRVTLDAANNFVENCRLHDFNRVEKSYRPGVWIDGVGNRVSRCDIYNAPSMAILFHGNNHVIEYCTITNVCAEVDDQGAIYYGRDPSELGNIIRYNYFHNLSPRHSVTATYHDDGACGGEVYGNIYHNAGSLPVLVGGGSHNHYRHNIFIDSPVAVHLDNRMQNWANRLLQKGELIEKRLNDVGFDRPPYSTAYPFLATYWENNPEIPHENVFEGNLFYKIENVVHGSTKWGEFCNNWATQSDPGFIDAENPLKGFRPNAEVFKRIKDFPDLPFGSIGSTLK